MKSLIWIILSGILIALSFPGYFIPFSWIFGFFILLRFIDNADIKKSFAYSFLSGLIFSILTLYWTVYAITYYGGVSVFLGIPLLVLLASAFSIYQFVFPVIVLKLFQKRYKDVYILLFPFLWVSVEMLRENIPFGGFPWNLAGYTLSYMNSIAQITSILSIYFLSFLAVAIPSLTVFFFKKGKPFFVAGISGSFIFILILHFWGVYRIENLQLEGIQRKISIVQGNISQDIKLNNYDPVSVIDRYADLIKKASSEKPDLIVLPESSLPFFYINGDMDLKKYFLKKIKDVHIPILLGSDIALINEKKDISIYNSVILLDKDKNVVDLYRKIKLVPFGEYVPFPFKIFSSIFPYLEGYDFSSGEEKNILVYKEWKIIPLICFEAIFPNFVADFSSKGNILLNVSNDGWFGRTVAPFQHFEMARVRAVETGKFLVRATNTGISAIISPSGVIEGKIGLFKEGILTGKVLLIEEGTFWIKNHKNIVYTFFILFISIIIFIELRRESKHGKGNSRGDK